MRRLTSQAVISILYFPLFSKVLDKNKSGVIEFDEFARLMEERAALRDDDQQRVFREAFKVFDQDESGKITAEELRCVDPLVLLYTSSIPQKHVRA